MEVLRLMNINHNDESLINSLVELHIKTLPTSLPSIFGRRFLRNLYFLDFINQGYIDGIVIVDEGKCIAYSIYTQKGSKYFSLGVKHNLGKFIKIMLLSLLTDPVKIFSILKQISIKYKNFYIQDFIDNLWLTLGIDPDKRNLRNESGTKLSIILIQGTIDLWRKLGLKQIQSVVRKDNEHAIQLYKSLGFEIIPNSDRKRLYYDVNVKVS